MLSSKFLVACAMTSFALSGAPLADVVFHAGNVASSSINTTGASLLLISCTSNSTPPTISDSKSNTWNLVKNQGGSSGNAYLYAAYGGTLAVGTGHTATANGTGGGYDCAFTAFAGFTGPVDQTNGGANGFSTTTATGSITPAASGELIFSVLENANHGGSDTINAGLTVIDTTSNGNSGIATAYLVQSPAAAISPTWTSGSAGFFAALIASFPVASVATVSTRLLMGVGR